MTYKKRIQKLLHHGFTRVERDDRFFDIYPQESREKGIELWQKWGSDKVHIIRLREPYGEREIQKNTISRKELEKALLYNRCYSALTKHHCISQ